MNLPVNLYLFDDKSSIGSTYGIGTYIKNLVKLLKEDVNINVVYLNFPSTVFRRKTNDGVIYWEIPPSKIRNHNLYCQNIVYLLRLYIEDTSNLVFQLNYSGTATFVNSLKKYFECKVINVIHGLGWCYELSGNVSRFRKIIAEESDEQERSVESIIRKDIKREQEYWRSMDKIVCLSNNTADLLKDDYGIPPESLSVVYNGLDEDGTINPPDVKIELRAKYGIPGDSLVVLFVGRLEYIKGIDYLIEAFRKILQSHPAVHLIIAGNGNYDKYMKKCGKDWMSIHFTGLLDKKELYDLYSIVDMGIMPSLHEQCSYVAIEMMMHGLPLIASTSTGLSEMVEDGVTGIHIVVEEYPDRVDIDTDALAEKMSFFILHPEKKSEISYNARCRYENIYAGEKMRQNMMRLYSSL